MKTLIFTFSTVLTISTFSQVVDMESFIIPPDSALFGAEQLTDGDTVYTEFWANFESNWNATWSSFAGFAFSNITDNVTPGYGNQFSAIPGSGNGGSENYSVCFASPFNNHRMFNTEGEAGYGAYFTNTTYAYYSMLMGDSFAKKFGEDTSASGVIDGTNGEDWFLLTIYGLDADSTYTGDSVNFYLADFRFADDSLDYIINDWTFVDLTDLGYVYGLDFVLTSSDTFGGFGMNTPAYFAMDEVNLYFGGFEDDNLASLKIYPNPVLSSFSIETVINSEIKIIDPLGRVVHAEFCESGTATINCENYAAGIYTVRSESRGRINSERIIKR
jgi:hypothetical protein